MPLHVWSSARFTIPLPEGHRFPLEKYALLRDRLLADGVVTAGEVHEPERVGVADLLRVHGADYVARFTEGRLGDGEVRRLGLPWSSELVERSYRTAGGTLEAAEAALERGVTMSLAGGTHHAFPDHGEGFCVFNDAAVAIRRLQALGLIRRALIVDLDVHQGNGTHAIFSDDPTVLTFSMHGARNYPYMLSPRDRHTPGGAAAGYGGRVDADVDVPLPDATGDAEYLALLVHHLPRVVAAARADLVVYLAGADPHVGDRLGRMCLTESGLARRDSLVLATCREIGLPVVVTIAGGYGGDIHDTVRIHAMTARLARQYVSTGRA
jgi:acetoin utilization deacetylase AcuC-like enzyme